MSTSSLGIVFPAANTRGGVERVVLEALRFFAPRRHTSFIGTELADGPTTAAVHHRRVHPRAGLRTTTPKRFRAAATAVLAEQRPDILISSGVNCPPGDVYWVHSVHRAWVDHGGTATVAGVRFPGRIRRIMPRHRVLLDLERRYFVHGSPSTILCTSRREVDDLHQYYDVPLNKMHVVPNGFDGSRFNPSTTARLRHNVRAGLSLRPDDISLLFVANELHRKGFEVLLRAVAAVGDRRLRVDVVGRADIAGYRHQISDLNLAGQVFWHGATAEVERWMAGADALVLPTQYEPFGLVIVEAMAMGLPVVTTRLAGAAALISPDVNGLIQDDPTSADELEPLIRSLLDDDLRLRLGSQAATAATNYEWSRIFERVESLIDSC